MIILASLLVALALAWVAAFFYLTDRWKSKDALRRSAARGARCARCAAEGSE